MNPKLILAWIHSKIFNFVFEVFFDGLRMSGGYLPYSAPYLSCMYYPVLEKDYEQAIITLINQIISIKAVNPNAPVSTEVFAIDRLLYKLYGLTEEEIKIIENS